MVERDLDTTKSSRIGDLGIGDLGIGDLGIGDLIVEYVEEWGKVF